MALLITGCSKPEEVISRRLAQANQNLEAGRIDAALKTLEDLNQTYIDQPAILEALGFAYARAERHTTAAASFSRAADVDPRSASLRQLAADSYLLAGDVDQAAQQYLLYVDEFPADFRAREKLGKIREDAGDLVRALDEYLECYRLRPSGEYAWRVGNVFRRLNNAPQTKSWLETTIRHGEEHVEDALLGLLELELSSRDFAAASRTVDQLDRIYPGTLDRSQLVAAREELAAWREQQKVLEGVRATQERAAREIEEERRRREAELAGLEAKPPATPPPAPATPPSTASVPATRPPRGAGTPAVTPVPAPATSTPAPTPPAPSTDAAATSTPGPSAPEETGALATPLPPDMQAALDLKDRGLREAAIAALWNIVSNDDRRADAWLELGLLYREMGQLGDAESCLLEAARRAPDNVEVTVALLEIVRESESRDAYFARLEVARRKFPGNADLAYFFARELAAIEGAAVRAISAYEDFLLLAAPEDPRRREANAYLSRVRGY